MGRTPWILAGLLSLALVGGACSLGVFKTGECATDAGCRDAFGPNFTCGEDGLCSLGSCTSSIECRETLGLGWACGDDSLCYEPGPHPRCISEPATILSDPSAHTGDLIIGSIFDQDQFLIMVRAARLAVIQVNDRDGLGGQPVGIIECTNEESATFDALTPEDATAEVGRYMVEQYGVPVIIGPATSGRSEVAYNVLSPLGAVVISPSATSPALTAIDGLTSTDAAPGLFWRTAPPDSLQGRVISQQMIDVLGATKVAVINQTGAYGEGLAEVFLENFVGDGRTADSFPFSNTTDLATHTAAVGATSGYDQVLFITSLSSDVVDFLNAAAGIAGFEDLGIFLTDGARDTQVLVQTAGTADGLYPNVRGTVPAILRGLVYDVFDANYKAVFAGEDPADFGFSAHAWDASWLALLGAAWADAQEDGLTGINIARGLRHISSGPDLDLGPTDWTTIRATFESGSSVDVSGASGALNYDPDSGETTAPIFVWRINDAGDDFEDIDCVDLSGAESLCPDFGDDDDDDAGDDDDSAR
jgi:ABC-type branched-subunit amino acid transport system substrate-binding protein